MTTRTSATLSLCANTWHNVPMTETSYSIVSFTVFRACRKIPTASIRLHCDVSMPLILSTRSPTLIVPSLKQSTFVKHCPKSGANTYPGLHNRRSSWTYKYYKISTYRKNLIQRSPLPNTTSTTRLAEFYFKYVFLVVTNWKQSFLNEQLTNWSKVLSANLAHSSIFLLAAESEINARSRIVYPMSGYLFTKQILMLASYPDRVRSL